ncbi:TetR/AcrR family transcriptional regulator [Bradyrhizobium sp. NP1]|uniref:TetR/AcrR family transcriptional regulator n=1 Tax=Bradyrhizobium sp. NP1 TaxID=3049772 RepID=UPI0025A59CEE|nr:TetR/AcrR family transcriptional regulator [Bradyrhizobium sp. NP1]WJR77269.1 TetR/AcrR family transcriptional regulator [Bradyrhizobium sp. NP1]
MKRRGHNTAIIGERTRQQILDVAERLFAEHGPEEVSIRAIAAAADTNLGSVNYHFGSKEKLFEEIFRRRVVPLNEQRLIRLDAAEAEAGHGRSPPLESIIEALVSPPLRLAAEAAGNARAMVVMQFLSHAFSSPNETAFLEKYYEPVRSRFIGALARALPHLSLNEVIWRYNFVIGAIIYAMGGPSRMTRPPKGLQGKHKAQRVSGDQAIRELVAYAAAGFRAAAALSESRGPGRAAGPARRTQR